MDIRRLDLDSKHVDKHKSTYTSVSNLSISVRKPRSVIMVKPLWAKDEDGKLAQVNDVLVNMRALRKLDTRNILIDVASTKNILVQDLNPYVFYLSSKTLERCATQDMKVTSLDVSAANVNGISISQLTADGIAPYALTVAGLDMATLTISPVAVTDGKISVLKIASLDPAVVNIDKLNLDVASVNALQANLLAVQALSPSVINVTDSDCISSVLVIDGSQWNVDTSAYDVQVTEETYAELAELKLIYNFEQSYNESIKSEVKLNDVRKLDRKLYMKWIKLLCDNKKCSIELIKSKKMYKTIGEAWIQDGNYNAYVKKNMLRNLDFLHMLGYDSVLVRFRCSEDIT